MKKDISQIIEEIGEKVKKVWVYSEDPENLSKTLNDISVLNWAMSQYQVQYEEEERALKAELDLSKAKLLEEFTAQGEPVNKAEIKATIQLAQMRKDYNKVASLLERIKITDRANAKVMDSARSRLALIRKEV
jgi:hypothetical protein